MARGVNKVILLGNLGRDPEVRYMPSGGAVTNIAIATSQNWKDRQSGEMQERTEWHNIVFFNRLAEIAGEYLKKGSQVYIEGSLRTRKYTDKNGIERYTTEIIADELQMLGNKSGGGESGYGQHQYNQPGQSSSSPKQSSAAEESTMPGFDDTFEDDLPF